MFDFLLSVTALVLLGSMLLAYARTRDVLHPIMFVAPLFLYGTVFDPWLVRNDVGRFFPVPERLNVVLILMCTSVAALSVGILHEDRRSRRPRGTVDGTRSFTKKDEALLRAIALVLAIVAVACFAVGIMNVGGFVEAFSVPKGGGYTESGYIGEGMNLGLVAAAMAGVSRYRQGLRGRSAILVFLGILPNLVQGTLGGRRGPLFLAIATGSLAWLIARRRRPAAWMLGGVLAVACLAVGFVWSQRPHLYLGSQDTGVRWGEFVGTLTNENADEGVNFVYGAAFVLVAQDSAHFTWGRQLAVNLLVRPVPKQLWPDKYEDVGATWVTSGYPGLGPFTTDDWLASVGWLPLMGSAGISIADVFGEFSWGAILVFYLVGRGFSLLYFKRRTVGGVWTLLYLEALIPTIYLATQSFEAFYYRYLILAVPTILSWRIVRGTSPLAQTPRSFKPARPVSLTLGD